MGEPLHHSGLDDPRILQILESLPDLRGMPVINET